MGDVNWLNRQEVVAREFAVETGHRGIVRMLQEQ